MPSYVNHALTTPSMRAIDAIPERDSTSKEMQVLSLGLSRTATYSMKLALDKLGYRTYHCFEIGQYGLPNEAHAYAWREALTAKTFGRGKAFETSEFAKLLRNYDAVTDAPCACFPEELIKAFPKAKVICSTRDPEKWIASMEKSYYLTLESSNFKWVRVMAVLDDVVMGPVLEHMRDILNCWTGGDWKNRDKLKQTLIDRPALLRSLTPAENLLEWKPQDGWEPLCKFLGKEVPNEPFPFENTGDRAAYMVWDTGILRVREFVGDRSHWPMLATAIGAFLSVLASILIYPIGATLVI